MAFLSYPRFKAFDTDGVTPLVNGELFTYEAGTSNPKLTYQDPDLSVPNAIPVKLDVTGEADVYLAPGKYKLVLYSEDYRLIWTRDKISSTGTGTGLGTAVYSTIADLKAGSPSSGGHAVVLGYHAPGDGGGGTFHYDDESSSSEDGGTIFKPTSSPSSGRWHRLMQEGPVNVKWFGAYGDGAHYDSDAIVNARLFCSETKSTLYFPGSTDIHATSDGVYLLQSDPVLDYTWTILDSGASFKWSGFSPRICIAEIHGDRIHFDCSETDTPELVGVDYIRPEWLGTTSQEMLSKAISCADKSPVKKIKLKKQIYSFTNPMLLPDGVQLIGEGYGTVLHAPSDDDGIVVASEATGWALEDLRVDGNGSSQNRGSGVYIGANSGAGSIKNATVQDFYRGVLIDGGQGTKIDALRIEFSSGQLLRGVEIIGTQGITLRDLDIQDANRALVLEDCSNILCDGVRIHDCHGTIDGTNASGIFLTNTTHSFLHSIQIDNTFGVGRIESCMSTTVSLAWDGEGSGLGVVESDGCTVQVNGAFVRQPNIDGLLESHTALVSATDPLTYLRRVIPISAAWQGGPTTLSAGSDALVTHTYVTVPPESKLMLVKMGTYSAHDYKFTITSYLGTSEQETWTPVYTGPYDLGVGSAPVLLYDNASSSDVSIRVQARLQNAHSTDTAVVDGDSFYAQLVIIDRD